MNKKILIAVVLIIFLGISYFILNNYKNTASADVERFFRNVNISMDGTPLINQPVGITVIAESAPSDISNATLEILLPEGFELVSGNIKWQGNLEKNRTILLKGKIKAVKTGDYAIQFLSTYIKDSLPLALDTKFLYVSVYDNEAKVSNTPSLWIKYNVAIHNENLKTITEKIE